MVFVPAWLIGGEGGGRGGGALNLISPRLLSGILFYIFGSWVPSTVQLTLKSIYILFQGVTEEPFQGVTEEPSLHNSKKHQKGYEP